MKTLVLCTEHNKMMQPTTSGGWSSTMQKPGAAGGKVSTAPSSGSRNGMEKKKKSDRMQPFC